MGVPTWTAGEVLTASDVNNWFVPQASFFTGTQTIGATSFADVTGQSVNVLSIGTYTYQGDVAYTPNQSAGSAKLTLVTPDTLAVSTMGINWYEITAQFSAPGTLGTQGNAGQWSGLNVAAQSSTMGTADRIWHFHGTFTTTAAGTLKLQAACTTGADTWTIKAGTWITIQRIA